MPWFICTSVFCFFCAHYKNFITDFITDLRYFVIDRFNQSFISHRWMEATCMAYALWEAGEPNNSGGREDCIETNWGKRGEWNDITE